MPLLLLQASGGIQIDPSWLITVIVGLVGTLSTVIAFLYRQQVAALHAQIEFLKQDNERKDKRAEKLVEQLDRMANVQDKGLGMIEAERSRR